MMKKELSILSFRRFASDCHARRWVDDFEEIRMMHIMLFTFVRIVLSALYVATGTENWHLTE